jgi:ankyrin repeat protein
MACEALIPYFFMTLTRTCGRFRWAYCQLEYLSKCLPGRIRHALDELPETLDATYERTLQEIDGTNWEFARRLLLCVAVVSRPLRVEELAECLAFDFNAGPIPQFREDWRLEDPVDAVLSTCSTLLALVNVDGSQVIQYSHFSVKEFLTSSRFAEKGDTISRHYHISMTAAHTLVAQACLGILLYLDGNVTRDGLDKLPLAEYAAEHWFEHARFEGVSQNTIEEMKELFDESKPHLADWLWIYDPTVAAWGRDKLAEVQSPVAPRGTPLHYAAFCGLPNIVKVLVTEQLQDMNSRRFNNGSTPLHLVSREGHVEVAQFLVEHGADATAQDEDGWTPLHWASERGHIKLAQSLVQYGAHATARDKGGRTPLHRASLGGHIELARFLVRLGADATAQARGGWTPLHEASAGGHIKLAQFLVQHGADATAQTKYGSTPLHWASSEGHIELAQFLVQHGANAIAQDQNGRTPLHGASSRDHIELARFLVGLGADATAQDEDGRAPLHGASEAGHIEIAQFLVQHGADVTVQAESGWTPLHGASEGGHIKLARFLVKHGADATARTDSGSTPLHEASNGGHIELAQFLVQHGANATAQDEDGRTPLHWASERGHIKLAQFLVEHGAGNGSG